MNVERLEKLCEVVKVGTHQFGNELVALHMGTFFKRIKTPHDFKVWVPKRKDVPKPQDVDIICCLVGFTIMLFGDKEMLDLADDPKNDQGISHLNLDVEASRLLDLDFTVGHDLFFGEMSSSRSGEDVARVLNKFLMTGEVDWDMLEFETIG